MIFFFASGAYGVLAPWAGTEPPAPAFEDEMFTTNC